MTGVGYIRATGSLSGSSEESGLRGRTAGRAAAA